MNRGGLKLFILLNLVLKLPLITLNQAEYTDGILQLTVFESRAGLYPPLYGALARAVSWSGLGLEMAGRLVSICAGSLAVIPVYLMTRRLFGTAAARYAALLFTVSPLVLRWSARVMTDSLFLLLSALCLLWIWEAWNAITDPRTDGDKFGIESNPEADAAKPEVKPGDSIDRYLAGAMAMAVLAALTRYQGAFLLVPMLLPVAAWIKNRKTVKTGFPWRTLAVGAGWIALPLWIAWSGFAHTGQFADRMAASPLLTALAYWSTAESFLLIAPYYMGYPVVALAIVGALIVPEGDGGSRKRFLLLHGTWGIVLLAIQSGFGSFQYRYMMPLLPPLLVLAGGGVARLELQWDPLESTCRHASLSIL